MGCGASGTQQVSMAYPNIQKIQFDSARRQAEYNYDNILKAIVPYFKKINQTQKSRQQFYDKLALKLGQLYSDTFSKLELAAKQQNLSTDQIRVKFSKKILLCITGTVGQLQNLPGWKKQRVNVFKGITNCQKKIIDFLQYKYPRNKNNFANAQLMEIFQEINNSEHTDYDLLINAGIFFDEQLIRTYERKQVVSKIKQFINQIINETNRFYDHYKNEMEKLFDKIDGTFIIGRKIPEYVSTYSDQLSENFEIQSPQIFRILIKWIEYLEGIFLNTQDNLKTIKFLKIMEQNDDQVSYFPLYTGKQEIIILIANLLDKGVDKYKEQQQQHQSSLANFNDLIINIINKNTGMPEVDSNQLKVIKYASYNGKFVQFLAIQKLVHLITELTYKRSIIQKKCRKAVDLNRCNIMDLLRSRFSGTKKQIINVFNRMKKLQKQDKIRIIRIKNRLQTPLNDVLINFAWTGKDQSFLVTQIQLVLQQNNPILNEKQKINGQFNHILYECLRSIFGPIAEMSLMITYRDSLMGFQSKIQMDKSQLQGLRCLQNDVLTCQYQLGLPYVCSLCNKFYPANQNSFPIHRCTICNFYACPQCLFQFDFQTRDECYTKQIVNFVKQNLHDVGDSQQEGFLFFDNYYERISKFSHNNKNYVDKIQQLLMDMNKKYAFVLKFQNGSKSIRCYSVNSGTILPAFYDYLPKKTRKKFKEEYFGHYDIVLFLDQKIKIQSRSYSEAFIKDCYMFNPEITIKKKVKQIFYFTWGENNYLIDVGEQLRDNQPQKLKSSVTQKSLMNAQVLQYYKRIEAKLEIDYMDLQSIDIQSSIQKQMNSIRYLKLKSNHLRTIDNLLVFKDLEEVSAQRNQILNLSIKKPLDKIRIIDLSQNFIEKISGISKQNLSQLRILNLQANNLEIFPTVDLPHLSWLNLNQNKLQQIMNLKLSKLPRLKKLSLNDNQLSNIPVVQLPNIRQIQANNNFIENLQWIHNLQTLQKISLNQNKIKQLPIIELQNLQQIFIMNNLLNDISGLSYSKMSKLKQIAFSKNQINHLPVIKFVQLISLNLSKNRLKNMANLSNCEFQNLKMLDLSDNCLQMLHQINAQNLEMMNFSKNQIRDIKNIVNCNLPAIKDIDFSENCIEQLPKMDLNTLQYLNLRRNEVQSIQVFFTSSLDKLQYLNISRNKILKIFGANFPSLINLDLHHNQITMISQIKNQDFYRCQKIDLSNNKLTLLPKFSKQYLEKLYLHKNKIEAFEGFQLSQFRSLEVLDMKENKLKNFMPMKLPKVFTINLSYNEIQCMQGIANSYFPVLEQIYISHNSINALECLNISRLSYIDLGYNKVECIQQLKFWMTPEIKQINLKNNQITNLCSLKSKGLAELILSQNRIQNVDNFCKDSDLKKLIFLKLDHNCIDVLPEMNFPGLKKLDVSHNKLTDIEKFTLKSKIPKINILKFSHNQIEKINYFNQNFKKLKQFYIDHNNVTKFYEFQQSELPFLKIIDVSHNSLSQIPKLYLNHLSTLNAAYNSIVQLTNFEKSSLKSLQKLNLTNNLLVKWPEALYLDRLTELLLANNKLSNISQFDSKNLPQLQELDIRQNNIENTSGIQINNLLHLHLISNNVSLNNAYDILNSRLNESTASGNKFLIDVSNRNSKNSNHSSKPSSSQKIGKKIKITKFDKIVNR